jgi:hypothetical protein
MEGLMRWKRNKRVSGGLSESQLAAWNNADKRQMRRADRDCPPGLVLLTSMLQGPALGSKMAVWYLTDDEIAALEEAPSLAKH